MSIHWTYCEQNDASADLQQGDIIQRESALLGILQDCHSYFCDPRYTGFIVLSQSCDLVRRNSTGNPKAQYITLGVIRELDSVIAKILNETCHTGIENVLDSDRKDAAIEQLKKIINQNEQTRGIFYLHPVQVNGNRSVLATRSIAMLRVSIALRRQHYETICQARRLSLIDSYSAKLGWLVGNLYSRIATKDWEDREESPEASKTQCDRILEESNVDNKFKWQNLKILRETAKASKTNLNSITKDNLEDFLKSHPLPDKIEVAAKYVSGQAVDIYFKIMETAITDEIRTSEVARSLIQSCLKPEGDHDESKVLKGYIRAIRNSTGVNRESIGLNFNLIDHAIQQIDLSTYISGTITTPCSIPEDVRKKTVEILLRRFAEAMKGARDLEQKLVSRLKNEADFRKQIKQ